MSCRPRSRLDLLKPNTATRVEHSQLKQRDQGDKHSRERYFNVDDSVYVRNTTKDSASCPGVVIARSRSVSYQIRSLNGQEHCFHVEKMRKKTVEESQ